MTGSSHLAMWEDQGRGVTAWARIWKEAHDKDGPKPSVATRVKFSPDGRLFATYGEADRLVRVWYHAEKEFLAASGQKMPLQFEYLQHPRAVTSIEWRKTPNSKRAFNKHILLTTCADGIARLWSETGFSETLRFFMCAIIDPSSVRSRERRKGNLKGNWQKVCFLIVILGILPHFYPLLMHH